MRPFKETLESRQRRDEKTKCLIFTGYLNRDGYGEVYTPKGRKLAHRVSALLAGIIDDLDDPARICHKCDNPPCIDPDHLYKGNGRTNLMDAIDRGRWKPHNKLKTHCKQGHPLSGENLILIGKDKKRRQCRICRNVKNAAWMKGHYARNKS